MTDNNRGNDIAGGAGANHETGDDNKRAARPSYSEEERKLRALAGQWKTPPVPMYSSSAALTQRKQQIVQQQPLTTIRSNEKSNLPDNSEEYAKALQEAYRKGAEAAARMAQQQQIPSAASCPDFSTGSSQQPQPASSSPSGANIRPAPGEEITMAPFHMDHQIHPPHHQMNTTILDPLKSSMPPPLPPSAATSAVHHQHHTPKTQITYTPQHIAEQQPFLQPQESAPPQYTQQQPQMTISQPVAASFVAPGHQTSSNAAVSKQSKSQQPGRSLSMPDMSTYAAEAEEDKRLKRLARNRASARLRRLRKKNLVSMMDKMI